MTRSPRCFVLGVILLLVAACASESAPDDFVPFWPAKVEEEWLEVRDCRLSPAEHDGNYVRVLSPKQDADAYLKGVTPMEPGSRIVKLEYSDAKCSELVRLSAMRKLAEGEAPELFDWEWIRTTPQGELVTATPARSCAGCHRACSDRDYLCTEP